MVVTGSVGNAGPRERLLQQGAQSLSDGELLAVLLCTGYPGASAAQVAAELLQRFGSLAGVMGACRRQLLAVPGLGRAKYALLQAALELARRQAEQALVREAVIDSPDGTRQFLNLHLAHQAREVFCCLFLDSQHGLICCEDLFFGTLDGAAVYPREVAVRALQHGAAAVILAHNHPSGVAEPSAADRRLTERLQAALGLLDIRVLDHFIVGRGRPFSFAESGLL
jgi:DNA repair protein RadC